MRVGQPLGAHSLASEVISYLSYPKAEPETSIREQVVCLEGIPKSRSEGVGRMRYGYRESQYKHELLENRSARIP